MNIKKIFKREPPINGGNTFEMEKILTAKEDTILNYVDTGLDTHIKLNQYNYWELLQFQADYFASTLRVTFNDIELDPKIYLLFRCNFLYGNVGLLKDGDDYIPLVEASHIINAKGKITKIIAYSAYEVATTTGTLAENKTKFKTKWILTEKDLENYARLYVPSYGFGAIVRWYKFVKQQEDLLQKIYNYSFLLTKKITYNVNDRSAATTEIKRFFSNNYPFLINLDSLTKTGNTFTTEGANNNGISSEDIFFYYEKWLKIYYELLGRRLNVDKKGERNITNEVEASQENFTILENEMKIYKTNFIEVVSKLTGKTYKLLDEEVEENNNENRKLDQANRKQTNQDKKGVENDL